MTNPADTTDVFTEKFADGYVTLEYEPTGGGQIRLAAKADGEVIESGEYNTKIFGSQTLRGQFLNSVEESLAPWNGVDATEVRRELKEWFATMNELDKEEQAERFLPEEVREIIEGTHYPVEVHGGETTTINVTLTYNGRTADMEFTAGEMVSGGARVLEDKIGTKFFDFEIEIEKEDWKAIKERWNRNKEIVNVVETTASDAVADRVLEFLGANPLVVADREDMGNDVAAVWYDETNATGLDEADADDAIAWVQDSYLVDQMETAGKQTDYKPELVKNLTARGDLYRGKMRKKWAWDTRKKLYPFDPTALGISADDVPDGAPAEAEEGAL